MDAEAAMRALCAAWERLDADAVAALFADDGVYEGPLFDAFPVGPEAVLAACRGAFAELTAVEIPLRALAATETHALAEGRFVCVDAEGARLDFPLVMVAEVHDGRVTRFTEYFDTKLVG